MKSLKSIWLALATLTLAAPAFAGHGKQMDIVDTAANAGTFETLIAAAKAEAGYAPVLMYMAIYAIMNIGAFGILSLAAARNDNGLNA